MTHRILLLTLLSSFLSFSSPIAFADTPPLPDEATLLDLLNSDAEKSEKAIACKQLAVVGSAAAAGALAELLEDPELASWSRIALAAIPGDEVDSVLIEALQKELEPRTKIGIANTLGKRKCRAAVEVLTATLEADNETLAESAAVSLGHIGGPAALVALQSTLNDAKSATVSSGAAEGLILIAEAQLRSGENDSAAAIYDSVGQADVPKPRVIESLRGSMLARGSDGVPLLIEQLKSNDWKRQGIALMTARELSGEGALASLMTAVDQVDGLKQALLVTAIAERDDPAAASMLVAKAKAGSKTVRVAAIEGLARIGKADSFPALLALAASDDSVIVATSLQTLASMNDDQLNRVIADQLDAATGNEKVVLLQVAAARRIDAVDSVKQAASSSDAAVRKAALKALGQIATMKEIPELISRVIEKQGQDGDAAMDALRATSIRMPDRDAVAEMLIGAADRASASDKQALLGIMTEMGGDKALAAMRDAAKSNDRELQDLATKFLGSWMTVDAGPVLMEIAKDNDHPFRIRALRGYLRIARQFLMNRGSRVRMAKQALAVADRDAEKRLILDVVERYPDKRMLEITLQIAKTPSMREDAIQVATKLVRILGGAPDTLQQFAKLWPQQSDLQIVSANYGADEMQKDVTQELATLKRIGPAVVIAKSYNATFGDPAPGIKKQLQVSYTVNGQSFETVFEEGQAVLLVPNQP
ncbi:MAG: HEAT repeat domain-containing protein [Planctomycetota bacterium]